MKSSNIGMSMLGERMGNTKLHRTLTAWGFGHPTGIELPGEDAGLLYPLKTLGQGQHRLDPAKDSEMMVTPLQLARGFCAYANGGRLVKPTLVSGRARM